MKNLLRHPFLYPLLVIAIAYCTYLHDFSKPPNLFWDENYHIASAEKFLTGTFFQEPHPPLGKLLIALGEKIVHPDSNLTAMHDTLHATGQNAPASFEGFRLFPALLGFLGALVFYFVMLEITSRPSLAFVLSFLYLFDNALIVHLRSAMLEGPQLFFLLLVFLLSLRLARAEKRTGALAVAAGCAFGAALNIKINSLDFAPLFLWAFWRWRGDPRNLLKHIALTVLPLFITTIAVWSTTYYLSRNINPALENKGFFRASTELKSTLTSPTPQPIKGTIYLLRDYCSFLKSYTRGVPQLNYCKTQENGSYPLLWPLGAKTISYRWNRSGATTQYLYLVANPVIWWSALAALLITGSLLLTRAIGLYSVKLPRENLLTFLFFLHLTYMATVLNVPRVLYLYHYFIPLILSFAMIAILVTDLSLVGGMAAWSARRKKSLVFIWCSACILVFAFFSPLTYYRPLTADQFARRSILRLWDLTCAECSSVDPIARPLEENKGGLASKREWLLHIGALASRKITQQWGEPREGLSVTSEKVAVNGIEYQNVLGVHAQSEVIFPLNREFATFSTNVGLPDYILAQNDDKPHGTVEFSILGDGKPLWRSGIVKAGEPAKSVTIDVSQVKDLTLSVTDAGDGINLDHACWLEPKLTKAATAPH